MKIAVEGPPGVGKSSLCRSLSDLLPHSQVIEEPVLENHYLGDYYGDPGRWALSMQLDLLVQRALAASEMVDDGTQALFYDRSLLGDRIFAKAVYRMGLMEEREYQTYLKVFRALTLRLKVQPDIILYLRAKPQTVFDRIRSRNRPEEVQGQGMSLDYLTRVWEGYEEFMTQPHDPLTIVTLDWNQFPSSEDVLALLRQQVNV